MWPGKSSYIIRWLILSVSPLLCACKGQSAQHGGSGGSSGAGGNEATGGGASGGEISGPGGAESHILVGPTGPQYAPVPGFEDCVHAEVKADCQDGWCVLPPSCVVLGAPEDEWMRGRYTGMQVAATLTRAMEVQQMEMSRAEWKKITSVLPSGDLPEEHVKCSDDACPIDKVTWWEAVTAANLLSEQRGLQPCYEPVNCTNELGRGLACEAVANPEKSVYDCEGYRLGTRAEAEYATKAGTYSTWYSGSITAYDNLDCNFDENLDKIGWYCFNSGDRAHLPGEKAPNGFGLHDLIGNTAEWLNEKHRTGPATGGSNPNGTTEDPKEPQLFGGSSLDLAWTSCRTSDIALARGFKRYSFAGFRLYRTLFEDSERSKAIVSEP